MGEGFICHYIAGMNSAIIVQGESYAANLFNTFTHSYESAIATI